MTMKKILSVILSVLMILSFLPNSKIYANEVQNNDLIKSGQPDYRLPAYTGDNIDYTDYSIQCVTVGKLNGTVSVGKTLDSAVVSTVKNGTITAVESRNKLTNYPSFKVNVATEEVAAGSLASTIVNFTFDKETASKNPAELLYYVEIPGMESHNASVSWNFYNAKGAAYYNNIYNGKCYMLKAGDDEWTEVKIQSYQFTIPANFKGYIKFIVSTINAQTNSPAVSGSGLNGKEAFVADTDKWLGFTRIGINGLSSNMDVYVSTPLFVTKTGEIPYAAFVDGEENAARNIFTGAVLTPNILGNGNGGSEELNPDEPPENDYKIPEYTGVAYNYDGKEFARIKQFILQDNIAKGYAIPYTTFNDGHADKNNGYSKLVDPLIGISNMPFFSITKTTGNPAESNVTVATWHPKKFETANANVGAILQYLKMPSDLEKAFCSIFMTAFDENYLAMNIAPYSGTIYYMEKGTTEWVAARITSYWFELPKGFEGYVMYDTKTLRAQNGGTEWGSDWTVYNYILRVANLNNQTVVASAPFWADSIGDIDYACWINDETKAVRDIFTGDILTGNDILNQLEIGDIIVKLPENTTDAPLNVNDEDAISQGKIQASWDAVPDASKYVARVFERITTGDGIEFKLVAQTKTDKLTATVTGLEREKYYAIVVYAYDDNGNEIAVFDYINFLTELKYSMEIISDSYTVSEDTISKITSGTTVSVMLNDLLGGQSIKVFKNGVEVTGDAAVGTGMTVQLTTGGTVVKTYTVVVTGDTNGDGAISVTDMIAIKAHILNKSTLSGVYAEAANTNGDSGISITDFIQVKAKILGKGEIVAR